MAAGCYWSGNIVLAELITTFLCMIYNGMRGSEVALCLCSNLSLGVVNEPNTPTYSTLLHVVDRMKTTDIQHLHSFVHKSDFLQCYAFSLFYYLVLKQDGLEEHLFPTFANAMGTESERQETKKIKCLKCL